MNENYTKLKKIDQNFHNQKAFFQTGKTKEYEFRRNNLIKLKEAVLKNERSIIEALEKDLGKPEIESVTAEIGMVIKEINYSLKNLKNWMRNKKRRTEFISKPGKSYIFHEPYGVVLIIAPWNYPFQLALSPLIGAICGGNCTILKPSEISANTADVIQRMIGETFEEEYISVVQGGIDETTHVLDKKFDKIFFTGSPIVGKIVMEKAAKQLIPVTLELGGKSPCIVDSTAKLSSAVNRIIYGKAMNAGQTCVAPDYLVIDESIKVEFYKRFKQSLKNFYGENQEDNKDYGKIINQKNFDRLIAYMDKGEIICGGGYNRDNLHIDVTLIEPDGGINPLMEEEIFGPVLPVITFKDKNEIFDIIRKNENPLALYMFSENDDFIDEVIQRIPAGGCCINDTVMHLTNESLPFGGRGNSGMGAYHGIYSFKTFTHEKAVMHRGSTFEIKAKYPPYTKKKLDFIKKVLFK